MILLRILLVLACLGHPLSTVAAELPLSGERHAREYVCPVCPHVADLLDARTHAGPGVCPVCGMELVEKPARAAPLPAIHPGAGAFSLRVQARDVDVFYYRPDGLSERSPVLIVLPGAGRNAWDYRDHWIEAADAFGVLVLALHYPERRYPRFWNYNIAGMISDVVVDRSTRTLASYRIVDDRTRWLFDDVDLVFDSAVRALALETDRYDLFGHSAGGQFLHRFALFARDDTRADRILASNAGWYTVPDHAERFPFGLAGAPITRSQLASAFARHLVVFLGGADDGNETRGDLVRSAPTDRQGRHRLARGRYFHERASITAAAMHVRFDWELVVVPGVGHDPRGMSLAAARYLYGEQPHHGPGDGRAPHVSASGNPRSGPSSEASPLPLRRRAQASKEGIGSSTP